MPRAGGKETRIQSFEYVPSSVGSVSIKEERELEGRRRGDGEESAGGAVEAARESVSQKGREKRDACVGRT
jgi:hypothetical protein